MVVPDLGAVQLALWQKVTRGDGGLLTLALGGLGGLLPVLTSGDTRAEGGCPLPRACSLIPVLLPGHVHPFSHLPLASPVRTGVGWQQEGEAWGFRRPAQTLHLERP